MLTSCSSQVHPPRYLLPPKGKKNAKFSLCFHWNMVKLLVATPVKKAELFPCPQPPQPLESHQLLGAILQHLYLKFKDSLQWFPVSTVSFCGGGSLSTFMSSLL